MDNDGILKQFDDIEGKVEDLIELCKSLEATNADLRIKIDGLEQEIQNRAEAEKFYTEQKALVRSKIDSLLSKLNDFSQS